MTCEELAIKIQNGDESLIPELWDRMRALYIKKAREYYLKHKSRCDQCGVTSEDMLQQSYFAFLQSIEAYEPLCEMSFSSYINYPFLSEMQALTYSRTSAQRSEALNMCDSLEREIDTGDGSPGTLGDFITDPDALYFIELIDDQSVGQMIRQEVEKLPERLCIIITGFYFDGKSLQDLGQILGISMQRASQLKSAALRKLRTRRVLVDLWNEMHHTQKLRQMESSTNHNRPERFAMHKVYDYTAARYAG